MALFSNAKEVVDELTLANDIALVQPTDLPLSDCMHRLIALDCSRRAFGRPEPEAGGDALLDAAGSTPVCKLLHHFSPGFARQVAWKLDA